ncbi:inactive protein kinase SELMODRAFT_444075-like [Abrus precatorius]|uniref:Inactive protein kinase SELMODRAFT_444075-like n=1 Tax=Abrus precatorius TaxID=3816 RepID=A0A8B8M983_ABRPR|nr:inactive protein kinase SELMODRAFT_444075-like [Abrus precatorius]
MGGEVILVAVDASIEISNDYALNWALQNVIKAEDILILLAVLPSCGSPTPTLSQRLHSLSCYFLACGSGHIEGRRTFDQVGQSKRVISRKINYVYANKMQKLWLANNLMQVHFEVKVIVDAGLGSVATKAKELKASWVILDRFLNKEVAQCIKQLNCNVVLMDHAIPRILKTVNPLAGENLNTGRSQSKATETDMIHVIPNILDYGSATTPSTSDIRSSTLGTNSFSLPSTEKEYHRKTNPCTINDSHSFLHLNSEYFSEDFKYLEDNPSPLDNKYVHLNKILSGGIDELNHKSATSPLQEEAENCNDILRTKISERKHNFERTDILTRRLTDSPGKWHGPNSTIQPKRSTTRRDSMTSYKHESLSSLSFATSDSNSMAMSLSIKNHSALCSICKHKIPIFRSVPRRFTYREIENATGRFSDSYMMADGGYSCVYRGELPDGQVIAVKQYKKLKSFSASEFCLEVEKLSCAQHRNLLILMGYCIDTEWLLIYEFACNGSLDKHLYGTETNQVMAWHDRMKVAVGTARGLRYLHEDCRAGCIVHGDLRPSNILLTHDFEPMIGDFGLARWQINPQLAKESTHLIGTVGYLSPEYIQTGQVSEKVDVYAFGVILLELLSGFNAREFSGKTGKQSLSEWSNTMLEKNKPNELIDSRLNNNYVEKEAESMMHAAYLCVSPHPAQRPRMSQVLKILEGDIPIDGASMYRSSKISDNGSVGSIKRTKDHRKLSQSNKTNLHEWERCATIPAFGNWDFANELPITRYFECARHTGLPRYSSSSAEIACANHHRHHLPLRNHHKQEKRNKERRCQHVNDSKGNAYDVREHTKKPIRVSKQQQQNDTVAPLPKPVVDEDLYKIPPELLHAANKRKKMLGFISKCLVCDEQC